MIVLRPITSDSWEGTGTKQIPDQDEKDDYNQHRESYDFASVLGVSGWSGWKN